MRNRPHGRSLGPVAIAAAAEDDDELAPGIGAQRLQGVPEGIRTVRIVDEDGAAVVPPYQFEPPLGTLERFKRRHRPVLVGPGAGGEAERDKRVADLEGSGQRQVEADVLADQAAGDPLAESLVGDARDLEERPLPPHRKQRGAAVQRREQERHMLRIVAVDHGGAVIGQQFPEQPELGLAVRLDAAMILEVVLGEVGVAHRLEADAVDTALVEPLAGGFQCDVVDPLQLEIAQVAVQGQRIGGGEFARREAGGGLHPDRTQACPRDAARRPDLAHEGDDRGFAVGARDGDGNFRLGREAARRGTRVNRAHIVHQHHGHAGIGFRRRLADHRHRAAGRRLGGERIAVHPRTGEREKGVTGGDGAAVGIDAFDRKVRRALADCAFEQLCQGE